MFILFFLQKKVEVKPAQPREVGPASGRGGGSKFYHIVGLFEKNSCIVTDFVLPALAAKTHST